MSALFGGLFSKKEIGEELCITNGTAINLNAYLARTAPNEVRNIQFADDIMGDRNELFVYTGDASIIYNIGGRSGIMFKRKKAGFGARANASLSQAEAYDSETKGTDKEAILAWIRKKSAVVKSRTPIMPGMSGMIRFD